MSAPKADHLRRRDYRRETESDAELQKEADKAKQEAYKELMKQREARVAPQSDAEIVDYLLDTSAEEMQYETVRCRPLITENFFAYLGQQIGQERFASPPNEDRVAELEGLRDFLADAIVKIDEQAKKMAAPKERLTQLLSSKDKRATLLEMAGGGQLDDALLKLLQQNIDAARAAGQEDPAQFMEKIRDAAKRFTLKT